MKTQNWFGLLVAVGLTAGCGNDGLLSSLSGADGSDSARTSQQAVTDLTDHVCDHCNGPEGTALELFADIRPEEYGGGPFEFSLVVGDPAGVVDANGDWRVAIVFEMNEHDLFAGIPAEAWMFNEDKTKARVVLVDEAGLPAGEYHAYASITDGEASASDAELYVVHDETEEPHADPTPTATPHEEEPHPTPTPEVHPV